ncbi:MAG: hypothetical protein PHR35_22315, partial [Kiritimatiellae bacterium]|nr:hypothetical protein [Kiritimatiellia bacterium]
FRGKTKAEDGGYGSWKATGTRVVYIIHEYLHREIERAMKTAVSTANQTIVGGILDAVKLQLKAIAEGLKVTVETPR